MIEQRVPNLKIYERGPFLTKLDMIGDMDVTTPQIKAARIGVSTIELSDGGQLFVAHCLEPVAGATFCVSRKGYEYLLNLSTRAAEELTAKYLLGLENAPSICNISTDYSYILQQRLVPLFHELLEPLKLRPIKDAEFTTLSNENASLIVVPVTEEFNPANLADIVFINDDKPARTGPIKTFDGGDEYGLYLTQMGVLAPGTEFIIVGNQYTPTRKTNWSDLVDLEFIFYSQTPEWYAQRGMAGRGHTIEKAASQSWIANVLNRFKRTSN